MTAHHPYHPIIYVRGFAATQGEIDEAVADPYMGFNIGSTKSRRAWTGAVRRFFFESPLVRLMSDHDYEDVYVEGDDMLDPQTDEHSVPYRSIVIYRYYDEASSDFGESDTPPIEHFALGLSTLITRLRDKICGNPDNDVTPEDFRVYLVAHSMGGLICRAFLQNPKLGSDDSRKAVDKFYTYSTPHNGIDIRLVRNIPGWLTFGDVNNFNRNRMAGYLAVPPGPDVSLVTKFPPERIFNLVGTNAADYAVAHGISSWAAGAASDGLVRIENATTHGAGPDGKDIMSPRAYVHRNHSGHYGVVNSEEGYQNLTRFFYGTLRIDGFLDIDDITLPIEIDKAMNEDKKKVRASYQFEVVVSLRGCQWEITRRVQRENSAIFRTYEQLFPGDDGTHRPPDRSASPHLFSVFLDPAKSQKNRNSVAFAFDIKVLVPDYEVAGVLFMKRHFEGGYIFRDMLLLEALRDDEAPGGWRIKYGFQSTNPGKPGSSADTLPLDKDNPAAGLQFEIPIEQSARPGLIGKLRLEARPWD